jgi:hypothetical protein
MLQRTILSALVVLGLAVVALGQDKDKPAADKDKPAAVKDKPAPEKDKPAASDKDKPAPEKDKPVADKGNPDKANLVWKFEKDKPFYQKMTTTTKQDMTVMGNKVNQTQTQTFYFSWTPEKQEGDSWVLKQKIEGVTMEIDIGGNKIPYDSLKDNNANNPLGEFFKALVGSEFKITVSMPKDKEVTVTKVEGRDEFIKKLGTANPQMQPLLNQILSEKALMEMAAPTFAALPNKEVDLKTDSKTWKRTSTLDMGPIGKYENAYTYTFEGKDDKGLDKIKVETKLTYKEPGEGGGVGALPFRIKKAKLESKPSTGLILYNPDAGRIEKSTMKLELEGELDIEIGGQTTTVKLSQTQDTVVEAQAKNVTPPAAPPK